MSQALSMPEGYTTIASSAVARSNVSRARICEPSCVSPWNEKTSGYFLFASYVLGTARTKLRSAPSTLIVSLVTVTFSLSTGGAPSGWGSPVPPSPLPPPPPSLFRGGVVVGGPPSAPPGAASFDGSLLHEGIADTKSSEASARRVKRIGAKSLAAL